MSIQGFFDLLNDGAVDVYEAYLYFKNNRVMDTKDASPQILDAAFYLELTRRQLAVREKHKSRPKHLPDGSPDTMLEMELLKTRRGLVAEWWRKKDPEGYNASSSNFEMVIEGHDPQTGAALINAEDMKRIKEMEKTHIMTVRAPIPTKWGNALVWSPIPPGAARVMLDGNLVAQDRHGDNFYGVMKLWAVNFSHHTFDMKFQRQISTQPIVNNKTIMSLLQDATSHLHKYATRYDLNDEPDFVSAMTSLVLNGSGLQSKLVPRTKMPPLPNPVNQVGCVVQMPPELDGEPEGSEKIFRWMQNHLHSTTGFRTGAPPSARNPTEDGSTPDPWVDPPTPQEQTTVPGSTESHPLYEEPQGTGASSSMGSSSSGLPREHQDTIFRGIFGKKTMKKKRDAAKMKNAGDA